MAHDEPKNRDLPQNKAQSDSLKQNEVKDEYLRRMVGGFRGDARIGDDVPGSDLGRGNGGGNSGKSSPFGRGFAENPAIVKLLHLFRKSGWFGL